MTEHRCVRPSTPVTRSEQGRVLIKSSWRGCMCQVHPLSTTKPMLVMPDSRRRECEEELRRCREANITLAGVDGGAETVGCGAMVRSFTSLSTSVVAAMR
eukprot:6214064-Pleurochrysis_carterae.AAC.1